MSWDATLLDADGEGLVEVNYTHNINAMVGAALRARTGVETPQGDGPLGPLIGPVWWERLDGMSGDQGAAYLSDIIAGLEADPDTYRAMNPPNGWGDYDSLLTTLRRMRDGGAGRPSTRWRTSG